MGIALAFATVLSKYNRAESAGYKCQIVIQILSYWTRRSTNGVGLCVGTDAYEYNSFTCPPRTLMYCPSYILHVVAPKDGMSSRACNTPPHSDCAFVRPWFSPARVST